MEPRCALVQAGRSYAIYLRRISASGPFSVRWTGSVVPDVTATYTFHTMTNDGVRLWIDDRPLIDQWVDQSETEHTGQAELQAGHAYAIKMEYFYNGGQGAAKLWWSREGLEKQPIPRENLRTPTNQPGLRAEYFQDRRLRQPWTTRIDDQINFVWGTQSPFERAEGQSAEPLVLDMPEGKYAAEWVDVLTGEVRQRVDIQHPGGQVELPVPAFGDDVALRIKRI